MDGQWKSAGSDAAKAAGPAGEACLLVVGGLEPELVPLLVGCSALAIGGDISSATMQPTEAENFKKIIEKSAAPLEAAVGNLNEVLDKRLEQLEEDIARLINCQQLSSALQKLRIITHQYVDSMAAGEVMDTVYPNFAVWSSYVDPSAWRAFILSIQGCRASVPRHAATLVAARTQMFALESLYWKRRGDARMLQHTQAKTDEDMRQFQQTQLEMCLYNHTLTEYPSDVPSNCICVKNSALPRDLTHFPGGCPDSKTSSMGGPLSDLPRSLVYANFSALDAEIE
eukprot:961762-Amphidinium_carterae.1